MSAKVEFYESIADELLKFVVIIAKTNGKYVFSKHRRRDVYEIPGGRREPNESIEQAAARELYEETGAIRYDLRSVCVYSVTDSNDGAPVTTFGMMYFADVHKFERELHYEMESIILSDALPTKLRFPEIYPKLFDEFKRRCKQ